MVSLNLRLIGARIFCFRRFCQALIHVEPQAPQTVRESLPELGTCRARRHTPELSKPVRQVAPGSGQVLLDGRRDRFGDVAALQADLLAQEMTRPRLCPDLAGQALELGRARDKRGQVEAEGLFDRSPLPFPGVALAVGAVAADHEPRRNELRQRSSQS